MTGSIIGNSLLVLGLALLLGGLRRQRQVFNRTATGLGSTLLALSAIGLLVPAVVHAVSPTGGAVELQSLSVAIAVVLFVTYLLSLLFTLRTHQHLFAEGVENESHEQPWSKRNALLTLLGATAAVGIMSELLVGSIEHTAEAWGMSQVFVGVILLAIIGNAASIVPRSWLR